MPRPSRIRRILKWTGVGLLLLFLILWITSLFLEIEIRLPVYVKLDIYNGYLSVLIAEVNGSNPLPKSGISQNESPSLRLEWPGYMRTNMTFDNRPAFMMTIIGLPFWLLLLLTAIPTAWLWHRDRRLFSSPPDHLFCLGCGYDLTGNLSGVCPECGEKTARREETVESRK